MSATPSKPRPADQHQPHPERGESLDVVDVLRRLIAADSQNPVPGEGAIADLIVTEYARPRGFEVTRLEFTPGRTNVILSVDRGPGPHLALSGHLDTKPVGDAGPAWATDPLEFTIIDGLGYGLGASDMKGSVAAMLVALERFAADGPNGQVSVVLTADEEAASQAGVKPLLEGRHVDCDAVVLGEPSGLEAPWQSVFLVSRGICCVNVDIWTRQGHSGLSSMLGQNANLLAAELILAFERYQPTVSAPGSVPCAPTVNAGMLISGGVGFGTWPGYCRVGCELRLVPGMDRDVVRDEIEGLVAGVIKPEGRYAIRYSESGLGWSPGVAIPAGHPVVAAARVAYEQVLGYAPTLDAYPGSTEATHYLAAGIPAIASLGPGWLSVAHGANECVGIDQLHQAVDIYTQLTDQFLR